MTNRRRKNPFAKYKDEQLETMLRAAENEPGARILGRFSAYEVLTELLRRRTREARP